MSTQASTVLDSMLAVLAKSSSGHTAAALLDQWRAITLGGVLAEGGGVETEAGTGDDDLAEDARTLARYGKPTEVITAQRTERLRTKIPFVAIRDEVPQGRFGCPPCSSSGVQVDGVPHSGSVEMDPLIGQKRTVHRHAQRQSADVPARITFRHDFPGVWCLRYVVTKLGKLV